MYGGTTMSFAAKKYDASNQCINTISRIECSSRRNFFRALTQYCAQNRGLMDGVMLDTGDICQTEYFYSLDDISSLEEYEDYVSSLNGEDLARFTADYMKERS